MEIRTAESAVETLERESDDRPLIEAAQSEPARFAELYDQNFARVYGFFARRVSSREEAQDLTAEVFHQALASIRRFKWQGAPFIAWLYGIAANVLSKHWAKQGKHVEEELTDLSSMGGEIERSVMLAKAVETLLPDQKHVIVRRFVDQKSIREIAQELGRSEGAIKQLQLRALENLRAKLGGTI
ncbi:MAG TPA: sigma-70 family RNA polymerase sigma factor [Terriglobales bacterium]|nr:sigma-70 family RNA polymerase sigma factor [Terriglobales bacterium]